ncbi:ribonuclease HII [Cycloclasticus sp.]|uniref:ribonuclease HII n=1 Tax=Cycloclasticus sp. TaxID=2024830 RepID=UPI000C0F000A|nr:ribonuclease HII [Cycloclasticus sp.]PHR47872.1 MAG: ribonuclease HII [Cycloclasticus sp.]
MNKVVVGLDEVGRGCIAGPVVAAAVILDDEKPIDGLMDSKKLTKKRREVLAQQIIESAKAWSIGRAEVAEIDEINILQASLLAMKRAFDGLDIKAGYAKVDGTFYPDIDLPGECIKGGDNLVAEISAASIIAKVYRDEQMALLDVLYPGYGLLKHAGYPTPDHKMKLAQQGVISIYRQSFSPVRKLLP